MRIIKKALKLVFTSATAWVLAISLFVNVLFLYYFILLQTTTWQVFWQSNIAVYNWLQVVLSVVVAALTALALTMFVYILEFRDKKQKRQGSILETLAALLFSSAATGCTVCGAFILPTIGIAASLTALPLAGLEIKFLSILLLVYSIYEYSRILAGVCPPLKQQLFELKKGNVVLNLNKTTLPQLKPFVILLAFVLIVYSLPKLPAKWRLDFRKNKTIAVLPTSGKADTETLLAEINPKAGYELNASYGNLGPQMLASGVIDLEKFIDVYQQSGSPLTEQEVSILTKGSRKKIHITRENSYFLLNFFWAVGLANKNPILTEGDMVKYGEGQIGNFASTGGWSLSKSGNPLDYYAKSELVSLNEQQQKLVEEVSKNIYRPCCNNPTSFPDCNHGMALLGVLELMAASGATEREMYEAAKYFNAYWFPSNYYDLALYFKANEGKNFAEIDAKTLLSKDYSSVQGWQNIKNWLTQNGLAEELPQSGGSCGV